MKTTLKKKLNKKTKNILFSGKNRLNHDGLQSVFKCYAIQNVSILGFKEVCDTQSCLMVSAWF